MKHISFFLSTTLLSIALATACSREHEQDVIYEEDLIDAPVAIRFGEGMPRIAATKSLGPIDDWNPAQDLYIYGIAREGVNSQATADAPLDLTASGILINNVKAESAPAPNGNPSEIREYITVYSDPVQQIPFFYAPDRRYEFFGYYVDDAVTNPSPTVGDDNITLPIVIDGSQDIMVATTDKDADKALATQEVSIDRLYSATSSRRGVVPNLVFQHQLSRFNVQVRNGSSSQTASNYKLAYIRIQSDTEGTLVIATKQDKAPGGIVNTANPQYLNLIRNGHVFSTADNFVPLDELIDVGDVMVIPGNQVYKMKIGLLQMGYTAEGIPAEADYDIDLSKLLAEVDAKAEPGCQYNVKIVIYGLEEIKVSVSLVAWEEGGEMFVDPDGDGQYVPVSSVTVSPTELTLAPGESETLEASVYPLYATNRNVSWSSSNPSIATVSDEGLVTAVAAGEAIITATAGNTSASCSIEVIDTSGQIVFSQFNVNSILLRSATFMGAIQLNGDTEIERHGFCISTDSMPTVSSYTHIYENDESLEYTTEIKGLTPSTHYYARQYVVIDNKILYGEQIEFFTLTPPVGAAPGLFWVGNKYVYIAKGNLIYDSDIWSFSEQQLDNVGSTFNMEDSLSSENASIINGGNISGLWRLPIKDEWLYLSGNAIYAIVGNIEGLVLLPSDSSFNLNKIQYLSSNEWAELEKLGAVFLKKNQHGFNCTNGSTKTGSTYWSSTDNCIFYFLRTSGGGSVIKESAIVYPSTLCHIRLVQYFISDSD